MYTIRPYSTFGTQMRGVFNKHLVLTFFIFLGFFSQAQASSFVVLPDNVCEVLITSNQELQIHQEVRAVNQESPWTKFFAEVSDVEEEIEEEESKVQDSKDGLNVFSAAFIYAQICVQLYLNGQKELNDYGVQPTLVPSVDLYKRFQVFRI
ncbi:hypothetical protein [Cytophaga sp. FL35]|uniref:hypothetical protein n=1 Tax=Cytophaga sp. FL35 TaxID=1904456 RepID=UPI001653B0AD|nr:hypothetical protein [Cytophaga sp. FL35]MBC6998140.1 hypothetical protein [Cytophaga sp. FL35]